MYSPIFYDLRQKFLHMGIRDVLETLNVVEKMEKAQKEGSFAATLNRMQRYYG